MRQKVVLIYSVAALLGCSGPVEYEHRIEQSVNDLKDLQKYDTYLAPSVGGGLQDFGVQLRPPKPLAIDPNSALQVPAEVVDISESYSGVGAGVPVVLHVLATRKNPRAPAEGEPAPPARNASQFYSVIDTVMNTRYGVGGGNRDTVMERGKTFTHQKLETNSGVVEYYVYEGTDRFVALIWEVPASAATSETARPGISMSVGSLSTGS